MPKLGPTGDYPEGKLNGDDEGGIAIGVAYDPEKDVVVVNFGKLVKWVAMPPANAIAFARMILSSAYREHDGKNLPM